VAHLLRLAAAGGGREGVVRVVAVAIEPAVQVLVDGGEVVAPQLLAGTTSAALGVHAVSTALLVAWETGVRRRRGMRRGGGGGGGGEDGEDGEVGVMVEMFVFVFVFSCVDA